MDQKYYLSLIYLQLTLVFFLVTRPLFQLLCRGWLAVDLHRTPKKKNMRMVTHKKLTSQESSSGGCCFYHLIIQLPISVTECWTLH